MSPPGGGGGGRWLAEEDSSHPREAAQSSWPLLPSRLYGGSSGQNTTTFSVVEVNGVVQMRGLLLAINS